MNVDEAAMMVMGNIDTKDKPAQFSPLVTSILVQVISQLIVKYGPILLDKILNRKPLNLCDRFAIKQIVKQCCPTKGDYRENGQVIVDAIIKSSEQFTPEQIITLVQTFPKA